MSITGRTYLERGKPVAVLEQWAGKGPRNVLIQRGDGTRVVRPFRGLRRPPPGSAPILWERMEDGWRCPFLGCHVREAHEHPVCPDCGAVRYGNMFCQTCTSVRSRDLNPHRLVCTNPE